MKRKRRTLPASHGGLSPGITVAITGVEGKSALGQMRYAEADDANRFLRRRGLYGPLAAAVQAAEESPAALDSLAAWLLELLQAVARPELDSAAQHKRLLLSYRSAPPGEKATTREALAVLLGIKSKSVAREARRARRGGPGKPGRPRRGK